MNRFMKTATFFVALILSFSICTAFAQAASSDTEAEAIRILKDLGVADLSQSEEPITRGEFAKILVNIMGRKDIAPSDTIFCDVKRDEKNSGYIQAAADEKILSGYSDGYFRPFDSVTYYQALKPLVNMTGYERYATVKGGFPMGYSIVADNVGILRGAGGIHGNEPITQGKLAVILKNTLTVSMLEFDSVTDGDIGYTNTSGKTLLKDKLNIYLLEGQIRANKFTQLSGISDLDDDQIKIDDKVFYTDIDLTYELGKNYLFYIKDDTEGKEAVLSYEDKYDKNKVEVFSGEDIVSLTNSSISYKTDDTKGTMSFTADTDMIYNGRAKLSWSSADILTDLSGNGIKNVEIRLLDNDDNGKCDVIFVNYYTNMTVDRVNTLDSIINFKNSSAGRKINLSKDADVMYIITDADNNKVNIEDIEEWNVLSVTESLDKKAYMIRVGREYVEGEVSAAGDDFVVINDKEYNYDAKGYLVPELGQEAVYYLNYLDVISAVDIKADSVMKTAYLLKMGTKGSLSKNIEIKLFTKDGEFEILELADKVKTNTASVKESDILSDTTLYKNNKAVPQLIKYSQNESGEITRIYAAKDGQLLSEEQRRSEFTLDSKFASVSYRGGDMKTIASRYILSDETVIFAIPTDLDNEKMFNIYTVKDLIDDQGCSNVYVYDVNEDYRIEYMTMEESGQGNITHNSNVGIVTKVVNFINSDGEDSVKLTMLVYGKEYIIEPHSPDLDVTFGANVITDLGADSEANAGSAPATIKVSKLKKGDIIQYSTNSNGKMTAANLFLRGTTPIHKEYANYGIQPDNVYSAIYYCYGKVLKPIDGGVVVSVPAAGEEGVYYTRTFPAYGSTVYLRYDSETKECVLISADDISIDDNVFIHARLTRVTTVIVYK